MFLFSVFTDVMSLPSKRTDPLEGEIKPDIMRVITAVTNGIGVMPSYQGELSTEEIEAVAHYVSVSAE